MGTTTLTAHTDTISDLRATRDHALVTVRKLASMLRGFSDIHPLTVRVEDDLCVAMDKHADAENALRLAVDGYEETYSHPAGGVHPTDAYSSTLLRR